nr:sulfite exporter TauE/SafE family protein [uncultured Oscillibacter sp.]
MCSSDLLGAALGGLLAAETVKVVLYVVVLLSGAAIAIRELRPQKGPDKESSFPKPLPLLALGFATALLCALSGAGGPVLVMPLLVAMGVPAKMAVGVALLDSVFIALPAIAVYASRCETLSGLAPVLLAAVLGHAAGVFAGSVTAAHVPQSLLKRGVAIFSICFSLFMLLK